jgi:ribosomal protein S18 acetylase RimI-like enzyme
MWVVTVRKALESDRDYVERLVDNAYQQREPWALSWTRKMLAAEMETADVFIAVDENSAPVGFACLRPPGFAWELTLVVVDPQFRGRGIVGSLLDAISRCIRADERSASGSALALEVRADNRPAIRAYEAYGFREVGRRRGYYADGVDAILYTKA